MYTLVSCLTRGGTAVNPNHNYIAVYNLQDGLDLYTLTAQKKAKPKRSYKFDKAPNARLKLQVAFVHKGHGILCGTTTGKMSVWETVSGELFQHLEHGGESRSQIKCPKPLTHHLHYGRRQRIPSRL